MLVQTAQNHNNYSNTVPVIDPVHVLDQSTGTDVSKRFH